MATKAAAFHAWAAGFGIPAYAATSVPSEAQFPYLTYVTASGDFWGGETAIEVDLWYRGDTEAPANAKAEQIAASLGNGGTIIPCDGGAMWLKQGSPFCQSMGDSADAKIKRRYINVTAEYITS